MGKYTKNVHTVKIDESGLRTVSFYSLKYCINPVLLDTKVSTKTTAIIEGKYLNSISNSSPSFQTSQLEAFHSLVLQYAPKHTAFSYRGMLSRYV